MANGKILLRNPEAAKCVDVDGNIKEDSKHILYECSTDKKMQQFSLKSLSGKSLKAKKEKIIKKIIEYVAHEKCEENVTEEILKEKIELDRLYKDYITESSTYQDQQIYATQQNDVYYLWTVVAVFLVFVTFKSIFCSSNVKPRAALLTS